MRRIVILLFCIAILAGLCINVSATTGISSMVTHATVSTDGTCQVSTNITFHLDQPLDHISFPVPKDAVAVSLNGSRVATQAVDDARIIDLSKVLSGMAGDFAITVSYRLSGLVTADEEGLLHLNLPLLSGFSYPVQAMEATITMPGPIDTLPGFTSGYHQANIERDLSFTVDGATITCRAQTSLKDHETLSMVMLVSNEMFPQTIIYAPDVVVTNTIAGICAGLAFLYWLLFLRCLVPFGHKRTVPPEGLCAGQMVSVLHLTGADLTLMVFTWAQLGYLTIYHSSAGRVTLYKQMEMGNERSGFERRCFNALFSRKTAVDTASAYYVQLHQKISSMPPNVQNFIRKGSGNVRIFRFLGAVAGLFFGISLGLSLSAGAAVSWLLIILCALFGLFSSRYIHLWACSLWQRDKSPIWISLALCCIWLVLGGTGMQLAVAGWAVTCALLIGLLSAFSGRRTPEGRQAIAEVLGLRRYLVSVSAQDIRRICSQNAEYFHDLAPYALALNADRAFSRQFGGEKISCPYIVEDRDLSLTAAQWSEYMRLVADTMNARVRQKRSERIKTILRSFFQ